jgi:uncharacterized 2Fe-2S/4Fe-4S cluster protein (DUF4445 family)
LAEIDHFQRAKASTAAAISVLLSQTGLNAKALHTIYICGLFGQSIQVSDAIRVGLLPAVKESVFQLRPHAALNGCERALLSRHAAERFSSIAGLSTTVNLVLEKDFDDTFIRNLPLRPFS